MAQFDTSKLVRQFNFTDEEMVPFTEEWGIRADDEGLEVALVEQKTAGVQEMSCGYARMYPGQYHPKHHHPHGEQLYFFLEGEGIVTLGDEKVEVKKGTLTFFPRNCIHSIEVTSEGPLGWFWSQSKPYYELMGIEYDEPEREL